MVGPSALGQPRDERRKVALQFRFVGKIAFWLVILGLMLPSLFFFFWMISLSFKSQVENTAYPPIFLPSNLGLESYAEVFRKHPFPQYARNSIVAGSGATSLALLIGVPAAYGNRQVETLRDGLADLACQVSAADELSDTLVRREPQLGPGQ